MDQPNRVQRTLYPYQESAVEHLLGGMDRTRKAGERRWEAVVMPTAAGKTLCMQTAVFEGLRRGTITRALLCTPMVHIEDAFDLDDDVEVTWMGQRTTVSSASIARLRDSDLGAARALAEWLAGGGPPVMLTSHAQLVRLLNEGVLVGNADLRGAVLGMDEAHHAAEGSSETVGTKTFDFANAWEGAGGTVWSVTATPDRTDAQPVFPASVRPLVIPYSRVSREGGNPRDVRIHTREIRDPDRDGTLSADDFARAAQIVAEDPRPTVVRVPPGNGSTSSAMLAARMIDALVEAGIPSDQILNAVGTGQDARKAFRERLAEERKDIATKGYAGAGLRVIVACRRMGEGSDWPICARIVSFGMPTSVLSVLQLAGRGLRSKGHVEGYPSRWAQRVDVEFLVPRLAEDSAERVNAAKRLLLITCALEGDSDSLFDLGAYWEGLVKGFRLPPVLRNRRAAVENLPNMAPEEHAEAISDAVLAGAWARANQDTEPTLGEVLGYVRTYEGSTSNLYKTTRTLIAHIAQADPEVREALEAALAQVLSKVVDRVAEGAEPVSPDDLHTAFEDAMGTMFEGLGVRFADRLVSLDKHIEGRMTGALRARELPSIARQVAKARATVAGWTWESVAKLCADYREKYKQWPALDTGPQDVSALVQLPMSLRDVDRWTRGQGLPLTQFVQAVRAGWVTHPLPQGAGQEVAKHLARFPGVQSRLDVRVRALNVLAGINDAQDPHLSVLLDPKGRKREPLMGLWLADFHGWRGLQPGSLGLASTR